MECACPKKRGGILLDYYGSFAGALRAGEGRRILAWTAAMSLRLPINPCLRYLPRAIAPLVAAAALLACALLLLTPPPARAGSFNEGTILARAAFNPVDNQYLVVYMDTDGSIMTDVKGVILASDGETPVGEEFTIVTEFALTFDNDYNPNSPAVAFDPFSKRYLVVWTHYYFDYIITGRLVEADGTVLDTGVVDLDGDVTITANDAILISESESSEIKENPAVSFDSVNRRFLVVWADDRDSKDAILGRMVDPLTGALLDDGVSDLDENETIDALDAIEIATTAVDQQNPTVAFDPVNQRFQIAWNEEVPGTLATIEPASGVGSKWLPTISENIQSLAYHPDPDGDPATDDATFFATDNNLDRLVAYDPVTGEEEDVQALGSYTSVQSLAYNSANSLLYATDSVLGDLFTIDADAGDVTRVRAGLHSGSGLAYNANSGVLYGADSSRDELFTINKATGVATVVGALGAAGNSITGLAYDSGNDILYGLQGGTGQFGKLVTINTTTGAATLVGSLGSSNDLRNCNGLAFNPDENLDDTEDDPILYTVCSDTNDSLVSINAGSGAGTNLGSLPTSTDGCHPTAPDFQAVRALTFNLDPDGNSNNSDALIYGVEANNGQLVIIDIGTPSSSSVVGRLTPSGSCSASVEGLAFDAASGKLYGLDSSNDQLVMINTSTGLATEGGILAFLNVKGLAHDSVAGFLYAVTSQGRLMRITPATGVATYVGAPGAVGISFIYGLTFDPDPNGDSDTSDATLYGTVANNPSQFVTINRTTGVGTEVGATGDLGLTSVYGLAFDTERGTVVGVNSTSEREIAGRLVSADGTLYDPDTGTAPDLTDPAQRAFISLGLSDQTNPAAAYDGRNGRFVVVWEDGRDDLFDVDGDGELDSDIYGQLLDGEGALLDPNDGADGDLTDPMVNYAVQTPTPHQSYPAVAVDRTGNRYYVAWMKDDDGDTKVAYNTLAGDDLSVGTAIIVNELEVDNESLPSLVYNAFCRHGFLAYTRAIDLSESNPAEIDYGVNTACAPDPGLLWPATGTDPAPREITPTTVASGDTATFAVDYVSDPADNPPTVKELRIDLDGDGEYAAPLTSGIVKGPPSSPPPGFGTPVAGAAALATLLLLAAWGARRRPQLRPALSLLVLVLGTGLLASIAVTGCGGGGGGSSTTPTEVTVEGDVTVDASGNLSMAEGSSVTFKIVLDSEPTASVTMNLSSNDTTEGTVSPSSLTFTTDNWDKKKTVTVTGVQDNIIDGSQEFTVNVGKTSSEDPAFDDINPPNVTVTVTDSGFQEIFPMSVDTTADAALQDGDYSNGERYVVEVAVDGDPRTLIYTFAFSDGSNDASGHPAEQHLLTVTAAE